MRWLASAFAPFSSFALHGRLISHRDLSQTPVCARTSCTRSCMRWPTIKIASTWAWVQSSLSLPARIRPRGSKTVRLLRHRPVSRPTRDGRHPTRYRRRGVPTALTCLPQSVPAGRCLVAFATSRGQPRVKGAEGKADVLLTAVHLSGEGDRGGWRCTGRDSGPRTVGRRCRDEA